MNKTNLIIRNFSELSVTIVCSSLAFCHITLAQRYFFSPISAQYQMPVHSVHILLPDFLPAQPSLFSQTLCNAAWEYAAQAPPIEQMPETAPSQTLGTSVQALIQVYAAFFRCVKEQQRLADAYKERLTRWGVWDEYPRTALPTSLVQAMLPLRGIVAAFPEIEAKLQQGQIPDNIVFRSAWRFFCFRYGHRTWHEGDIALPRFAEDPKTTFAQVLSLTPIRKYDDEFPIIPKLSIKARLLNMFWQKYVAAQHEIETQRSETMRQAYSLRQEILLSAEILAQKGRLPSPTHIWSMSVHDLMRL